MLRVEPLSRVLELGLIALAAQLVPKKRRQDWMLEWRGELAYLHSVLGSSIPARIVPMRFVFGAFFDALTLRVIEGKQRERFPQAKVSPITCLVVLAMLLTASYGATFLLPGVRAERELAPAPIGNGLVLIQGAEEVHHGEPTIAPSQIRVWRRGQQRYFDGFAYYYLAAESFSDPAQPERGRTWKIAHATANLLPLLQAPVRLGATATAANYGMPALVLSESGWKHRYGADPGVMGRVVLIDAKPARIAGVAPDGMWMLPGNADAWLIDPNTEQKHDVLGYAVAHLTFQGKAMMRTPRIAITAHRAHFNTDAYEGIALCRGSVGPWSFFLYATFLALVTLPVIAPAEHTEMSLHTHELGWFRLLLRPLFYAAKLGLVWPIAYFTSLNAAYALPQLSVQTQTYLQLTTGFLACLFGVRWAILDQHRRCPVCLRRVTHPARVGNTASNLLAWSGTEMICAGGHTLLHIPDLPMSWFPAPRWHLRRAA